MSGPGVPSRRPGAGPGLPPGRRPGPGTSPARLEELDRHLRGARRGDPGAFGRLYERCRHPVLRVLRGFSWLDPFDREDVLQEAFLRAFQRLSTLRVAAAFEGWLHGIARNLALSLRGRRRRQARAVAGLAALVPESAPLVPEAARVELDSAVVRELIEWLPVGPEKETVALYYLEGELSTRRLGERLGVGKSAIGMRLDRFRARVRGELAARLTRARRW